jgi:pSer/pThr/pTyr-binding forkhead associated (FHA) protein
MVKRKSSLGMDKTQPALIVQHGNTAQKHRPIDRAGVTLGQARGCDIELDAPEVSTVHCLITRGPDGLYIRDCNSRMGTRVNGERIKECYLHDSDILQVGPFSFQVYMPPSLITHPEKGPSLMATIEGPASKSGGAEPDQALAAREAELQRLEESLQKQQHDLDLKQRQLEEADRQLATSQQAAQDEAEKIQEESKKIQAHTQQWERELEERQKKVDAEIQARVQECQQKCAEMEKAQAEALKTKASSEASSQSAVSPEKARQLEIRQQELDKFAKHLQTLQQRLREQEDKLRQGVVSEPFSSEEFKQGQQEILSQFAPLQEGFKQLQQTLKGQHLELVQALKELSAGQTKSPDQQPQTTEMLRQVMQMLQGLTPRRDQPSPSPSTSESSTSLPASEPKGRDKLAERLRAIEAKIPAVGSRQSRHD